MNSLLPGMDSVLPGIDSKLPGMDSRLPGMAREAPGTPRIAPGASGGGPAASRRVHGGPRLDFSKVFTRFWRCTLCLDDYAPAEFAELVAGANKAGGMKDIRSEVLNALLPQQADGAADSGKRSLSVFLV